MASGRLRALATLSIACAAVAGGCTGNGGKKDPDPRCDVDVARYEGYATDETCIVMLEAEDAGEILTAGINVPVLLSPTNGGTIASTSSSLTIAWDTPLDLDTTFARRPAARPAEARWSRVWRSLSPVGTAHAHEAPVTGAIHMLRVSGIDAPGGEVLTFTSLQQVTVAGAALDAITGAPGGEVTLQVTSMYLEDNRIVNPATDGPFRSPTDAVVTID